MVKEGGMTSNDGKVVQETIPILSVAKKGTKVIIVVDVSLGVQETVKEKRRESGMDETLSDGRQVMIPRAHDVPGHKCMKRRDIDTIETTVLDNLGIVGQEILATRTRG